MRIDEVPTLEGLPAWPREHGADDRLGEWLVNRGLLHRSQLFKALSLAFSRSCRLGDALVEIGALNRATLEREVGWLGAFLHRRRSTPPAPPDEALRPRRAPPVPASRTKRTTPPPLPASCRRRATPPPLPAGHAPDPGLVYLLTQRKDQP